jgi:hypothetical protein
MTSSTPLWVPLLVAVVGVGGSIASGWLTQHAGRRRDDERWRREREVDDIRWRRDKTDRLRELRISLYIDLADYVQRRQSSIEAVTDQWGNILRTSPDGLAHPQRLSARVKLLASQNVRNAWTQFEHAEDLLLYELHEDPDGMHQGGPYLKPDNEHVNAVVQTADVMHKALRGAMSDPDLAD